IGVKFLRKRPQAAVSGCSMSSELSCCRRTAQIDPYLSFAGILARTTCPHLRCRNERCEAALEVIRRLLQEGRVSYQGVTVRIASIFGLPRAIHDSDLRLSRLPEDDRSLRGDCRWDHSDQEH